MGQGRVGQAPIFYAVRGPTRLSATLFRSVHAIIHIPPALRRRQPASGDAAWTRAGQYNFSPPLLPTSDFFPLTSDFLRQNPPISANPSFPLCFPSQRGEYLRRSRSARACLDGPLGGVAPAPSR